MPQKVKLFKEKRILGKKKPSFLRLRKLGKFSVPQKVKLFKEKRTLGKKRT